MPLLNFKPSFALDVESGRKRGTIRAPRRDGRPHAVPGDRLYLYTGLRTRGCRKLGESICTSTHHAFITEERAIMIDGSRVTDTLIFARADGFIDSREMFDWFAETHGLPFEGAWIRWGDLIKPEETP